MIRLWTLQIGQRYKTSINKSDYNLVGSNNGCKTIQILKSGGISPAVIINFCLTNTIRLIAAVVAMVCYMGCNKTDLTPIQNITHLPKAPPTIVILGSSTAAGTGATPIDSAWSNRLQVTVNKTTIRANFINLALGYYSLYHIMPAGCSPERPAPDTARNITKALSYKPGLIILNFPSNDIDYNYTDDEIMSNYAKLTQLMDSAKVSYIIFSTQPRNFPDAGKRMRLKTLNDKIKSVYGNHVCDFLDQLSSTTYMIRPEYSAGDDIHLNNAGHAIIYNAAIKHPLLSPYLE
jgi:acyl-CoA thioesterase-1